VARAGQAVYSQNGDGYGVQWCDGEEVGVKCGCMQRCCEGVRPGVRSLLAEHGAGSVEYEDKQSRRCRAPIVGVAAARP